LWEIESRYKHGSGFLGDWEEMRVAHWPYFDPSSILVADVARLFGLINEAKAAPRVEIGEADVARTAAIRERANSAKTMTELPESSGIVVPMTVQCIPMLGVADPGAAIALSLEKSDGCYTMLKGDHIYHRSTCSEIKGKGDVTYSVTKRLPGEQEDRKPCESCKPELWDADAARNDQYRAGTGD
jgi:hypothetical protein